MKPSVYMLENYWMTKLGHKNAFGTNGAEESRRTIRKLRGSKKRSYLFKLNILDGSKEKQKLKKFASVIQDLE